LKVYKTKAQSTRLGDVAALENRKPVTVVKFITKKYIIYSADRLYSSAGTEADWRTKS